jgi:hypothetical protein
MIEFGRERIAYPTTVAGGTFELTASGQSDPIARWSEPAGSIQSRRSLVVPSAGSLSPETDAHGTVDFASARLKYHS